MGKPARSRFTDLFSTFGSAIAVSAAVERGARPKEADLRKLGIDPERFGAIGR